MATKKTGLGGMADKPSMAELIQKRAEERIDLLAPMPPRGTLGTYQKTAGAPDEAAQVDQPKAFAREAKEKQIQKCIYLGETICKELNRYRLLELPVNTRESAVFREMAVEYLQKRGYLKDYALETGPKNAAINAQIAASQGRINEVFGPIHRPPAAPEGPDTE